MENPHVRSFSFKNMCICVLESHISVFCFSALLAIAAVAVSCRLYDTVPQALKLSPLRQARYNSSLRTNAPTGRVDRNWTKSGGKAP